jgi:pilus assembly protein Flp/PilA
VAALRQPSIAAGHSRLKGESVMQVLTSKIRRFLASEDGPTAVEYAIMVALIVVALIAAVPILTGGIKNSFTNTAAQIDTVKAPS